jgi:hypothetical protein
MVLSRNATLLGAVLGAAGVLLVLAAVRSDEPTACAGSGARPPSALAAADPPPLRGVPSTSYDEFTARAVASLGRVGACMYEEDTMRAAAEASSSAPRSEFGSAAATDFVPREDLQWALGKRFHAPPMPTTFAKRSDQLRQLKTMVSIAIDRLRRDATLSAEYDALRSEGGAARAVTSAFERAVGNALVAIASYGHTVLQTIVDIGKKRDADGYAAEVIRELCALQLVPDRAKSNPTMAKAAPVPWLAARMATLRVDRHAPPFESQTPRNGRFWNGFRPTIGCSQLVRLCEQPDGCRYACNADFMLFAKTPTRGGVAQPMLAATVRAGDGDGIEWRSRPADLVGFGSNNEFDWEESLIGTFRAANASGSTAKAAGVRANPLRSIATFDCTLKEVKPTDVVRGVPAPGAFGFVQLCLDKEPSKMSISMRELVPLLRSGARPLDASRLGGGAVSSRNADLGKAAAAPSTDLVEWFGAGAPRMADVSGAWRGRSFERLAVLKVDVEGYEFGTVAQWLRDDLVGPPEAMPAADMLQFELHRMGHKGNAGTSTAGTLQTHLLMLHLYALGFIPFAQERNHADNCCYEFAAASGRFYVLSEAWLAARSL